jgi:hypothetical protein
MADCASGSRQLSESDESRYRSPRTFIGVIAPPEMSELLQRNQSEDFYPTSARFAVSSKGARKVVDDIAGSNVRHERI